MPYGPDELGSSTPMKPARSGSDVAQTLSITSDVLSSSQGVKQLRELLSKLLALLMTGSHPSWTGLKLSFDVRSRSEVEVLKNLSTTLEPWTPAWLRTRTQVVSSTESPGFQVELDLSTRQHRAD